MHATICVLACALIATGAADDSWKLPLAEKERRIEQNIVERHNILGLYPSQVEVPLDGRPVDNSTLGIGNIAHSVCWTANYLAGASYRYAFLKQSAAPQQQVAEAKARADELFEAVYRCQLVTGVRGLQARGYAIGHGESYEERWDADSRDEWHQGAGEYNNLRWRGDPSHHNYSDSIHGLAQYYDLAAEGEQKARCREAIDALVSHWVDNDLKIHKLDRTRPPVPILGLTDGKTLNTRVMMVIAGAKVAHHATGDPKFQAVYDRLIEQYGVRNLDAFATEKDFDDAEHVFCHLENLFRIEDDPEILRGYRAVLDGLWANHNPDAHSLFSYIYLSLTPESPGRDEALQQALFSLQTWPTDTTLRPRMNSLRNDLKPPYPVYAAAWDNEYIWKGNLLRADGWLSRIVTDVAVPLEDPLVLYAVDESGDLYQSRDGAATAAGWRPIDAALRSPVRAIDAAHKIRILAAACDDGFYLSTSAGYSWERLPVPGSGHPEDVLFDPGNPLILYAMTDQGAYRSRDYGERFLGKSWESLTEDLPGASSRKFVIGPGQPGRLYAILDGLLFTRSLDECEWQQSGPIGLGPYARSYPWLTVDPFDPDHALVGAQTTSSEIPTSSLLQETRDGGAAWSNDLPTLIRAYSEGGIAQLLASLIPGAVSQPAIDPTRHGTVYLGNRKGVLRRTEAAPAWQAIGEGLDIPWVRSIIAPRNTDWLFAGTPAGLFVSKDGGDTWEDAHLCLQWQKNTRREIGGAAFIDAYWRARYYGFIDDAMASAPWRE